MQDKIEKLRSLCSGINFADADLSSEEEDFRRQFNEVIIALCKSMPQSTQTDAILFFTQYLATPVGRELNFFKNYYAPAWSILLWLIRSQPADNMPDPDDIKSAVTAHAMALLLHPLDDHLHDGQLPATHLTMLLRSQAWMIMNTALNQLIRGVADGEIIVRDYVDKYYASIGRSGGIRTLDSYCDLFRKQMATWFIVPVLMAKKMAADESFIRAIQMAYGSFGIAWRLLDDLRDIETDMLNGNRSAIYLCLPEQLQAWWEKGVPDKGNGHAERILDYIREHRVIDSIMERLCWELESAAATADGCQMESLARELRCLARPLENLQNLDW
ncbi:hypothetical protein D1AOALGA4SA_6527 [Olavius algarvensis Delta 1 endosymbiont]|nr:hypothetical protein D1AOALGA4SA_6527 [Olavius algarvensis Delta 1 endosymbiont]